MKKRRSSAPHIIFCLVTCVALSYPASVFAAGVSSFLSGKFSNIFGTSAKAETEPINSTSQTMDLFKPVVIDSTTTNGADIPNNQDANALSAVSGPLRVSTEDVDFPTTDTISVYEVKAGDTIENVAKLFDVSVNTIMWANNLKSRTLTKGETILILPITGIKHNVKKGDTITSIAKKYKAGEQDIASYNGLAVDATLTVGGTIIVPDGEIEIVQAPKTTKTATKKPKILNSYTYSAPSGFLARPLVGGRRTQGIHGHNGVDIAGPLGTPVLAAANGKVILAKMGGYNGGYGNMIIISHDKGVQTVYGHLQDVYVTTGQTVTQGQTIGELGNSGRSTGPHLHFEVRGAKNPF